MRQPPVSPPPVEIVKRSPNRYTALDSWRGICACMVVLFHVPAIGDVNTTLLIRGGYLFTDFFFVLSGFIIFENYYDRIRQGFGLARFMFLRFGRLYPLHLFVLILFVAGELSEMPGVDGSSAPFADPNSFEGLYLQLALLNAHGLYPINTWNFPAWSIGAEFYTYLLFALVIRVAHSVLLFALAAIAAGATIVLLLSSHVNLDITNDLGLFRCVAGFAVGALCQRFRNAFPFTNIRRQYLAGGTELALLALVIAFVCYAASNRASFAAPLVFSAVIIVFARESGVVSRVLRTAPFRFVGTISYSIYMVHLFILTYISSMVRTFESVVGIPLTTTIQNGDITIVALGAEPWQGNIAHFLALVPVILVAFVSYKLVEVPARRWSRQITPRIKLGGKEPNPISG